MSYLFLLVSLVACYAEAYNPKFDGLYETFPKDDSLALFGYDISRICAFKRIDGSFYSGIYDAYTVFKAPYTKLQLINQNAEFLNCFSYKAHSYIITRHNNNTSIMRGRVTRIFLHVNYDKLIFDHLYSKLYGWKDNKIYEINMTMVDDDWLEKNKTLRLNDSFRQQIWGNITDIIAFNNTLYFIRTLNNDMFFVKRHVMGGRERYISKTEQAQFDFIPFLQISQFFEGNPKLKFNIGSAASTIVISLPSSSFIAKENLSAQWIILLYILDVFFVLIAVWGLKHLYKFSKNKIGKSKENNSNDVYVSLTSLPIIKNDVTKQQSTSK